MKKIKIQILCAIILLGNAASLHCMFSSLRSRAAAMGQRSAASGMSREAAARLAAVQQQERFSAQSSSNLPIQDTSTWSGWFQSKTDWFKSLFQRSPVHSRGSQQSSYASVRTVPFGARGFSTTVPQRVSWWDKASSFITQKLPEERFAEGLNDILQGTDIQTNQFYLRRRFMAKDLEKAKQFVDKNEDFINTSIKSHYFVGKGQTLPRGIRIIRDDQPRFREESLSIVMRHLFPYINNDLAEGNPNHYSEYLDTIKNYLELATYIANKGGELGTKNPYQDVYLTQLMPAYRHLHSVYPPDPRTWPFPAAEVKLLKDMRKIFSELDPIFEKLMPEFGVTIRRAQEQRNKIDSDPQAYRQALQDEEDKRYPEKKAAREKANREEYLKSKRKRKEILWRYAHNRFDMDEDYRIPQAVKKEWDNVDFIEDEYNEWLKDPSFINFYYGDKRSYIPRAERESRQYKAREEEVLRYKGDAIWDLLPGLTASSSKEEIKKEYRRFMLENHPDRLPKDMTDKDKEEIEKKVKEVNAAWDAYGDQLR